LLDPPRRLAYIVAAIPKEFACIPKRSGKPRALSGRQGVGWLAREHKVEFEKEGRALYVKLTAHEADVFKKHPPK
jgi:hypothetical protein